MIQWSSEADFRVECRARVVLRRAKMEMLTLSAKSHKGKNRIAEARRQMPDWDGKTWRLKRQETRVLFGSDPGPWGLVEPDTDENTDRFSRWVNLRDDANFIVTPNV